VAKHMEFRPHAVNGFPQFAVSCRHWIFGRAAIENSEALGAWLVTSGAHGTADDSGIDRAAAQGAGACRGRSRRLTETPGRTSEPFPKPRWPEAGNPGLKAFQMSVPALTFATWRSTLLSSAPPGCPAKNLHNLHNLHKLFVFIAQREV
jgi:hypothetical protein